jgi:hypothetical protein
MEKIIAQMERSKKYQEEEDRDYEEKQQKLRNSG